MKAFTPIFEPTVLVLFSGGIDSTALLHLVLTAPEYQHLAVHVHHVHFRNRERRDEVEALAVSRIYAYLQEHGYRAFTTSESEQVDTSTEGNFSWDMEIYNTLAGGYCRISPGITQVATGRTKSDLLNHLDEDRKILHGWTQGQLLFEAMAGRDLKVYPFLQSTKAEVWESLPKALQDLTWSCRWPVKTPMGFTECGTCHFCTKAALPLSGRVAPRTFPRGIMGTEHNTIGV